MNYIQYFDKLHITAKTSILTVLGQMPFFFVAIYLFKHDLIDSLGKSNFLTIDFLFIISLCFCLSVTWFAMNLLLALIAFNYGDYIYQDNTPIDDVFKMTTLYSIGYISLAILINTKLGLNFFSFILWAYAFLLFRMVWIGIFWYIYFKKNKNQINNTPTQKTE